MTQWYRIRLERGSCRRCGFHPWIGNIPWRRAWQHILVSLPGESHGQRSLADYSPWNFPGMSTGVDCHFNSWIRKICWRRIRLPTPVFLGFPCDSAGKESTFRDFPGGPVVNISPFKAGGAGSIPTPGAKIPHALKKKKKRIHFQCQTPEFDPWVGKIPWGRERLPTPGFWLGEFHGLYSPWGCTRTQRLHRD